MSLAILVGHGDTAQTARCLGEGTLTTLVDHRIGGRAQVEPGLGGDRRDDLGGEAIGALIPVPTAVPPRGSSPRAARSLTNARAPSEQARPGVGLLADRHRRGVHQVGAPGLDVAHRAVAEVAQGADELFEARVGVLGQFGDDGEADRRRHDVVGRLRGVDVVVGMDRAPERCDASVAITSLTFMFVDVPDPGLVDVDGERRRARRPRCAGRLRRWRRPARRRARARRMQVDDAAWRLIVARARATRVSSGRSAIGKLPIASSVCLPHSGPAGHGAVVVVPRRTSSAPASSAAGSAGRVVCVAVGRLRLCRLRLRRLRGGLGWRGRLARPTLMVTTSPSSSRAGPAGSGPSPRRRTDPRPGGRCRRRRPRGRRR